MSIFRISMAYVLLLLASQVYADDCQPPGKPESAVVTYIYDGDTVRLQDGRKVRLLGINTTEMGRDGGKDQPLARAAQKTLEELLGESRPAPLNQVTLYFDTELQDRYGRYLAHLYVQDKSLERELLSRGLAYHVAFPPNLTLAKCFDRDEQFAREAGLGLWSDSGIPASASTNITEGGYQRFYGKVERVAFAGAWWIELEGKVTAAIYPEHQYRFKRADVEAWQGQQLELEGWVYKGKYSKKHGRSWRVKLETPYAVTLGSNDRLPVLVE
ncbi:MAG: thermonuclease family protein [Porticoccaceae bacterium]